MIIVAKEYGTKIGKRGNCISIKAKEGEARNICVDQVEELHIYPACSISADVVQLCCENDIWIVFLDKYDNPLGEILPFSGGCSPIYKRKQLLLSDSPLGVKLVKELLLKKIENRIVHLKHILHNKRKKETIDCLKIAIEKMIIEKEKLSAIHGMTMAEVRYTMQGYEGSAGRAYFEAIAYLLPAELKFERRERNAQDVYNCALNYLYGILYAKIKKMMYKCRLDPYIGIMHTDTYNKPTFVYDFIESQRIICEEIAYRICYTGQIGKESILFDLGNASFTEEARKILICEFYGAMNEKCFYKKKAVTQERRIYLELKNLAKQIGEEEENVLGVI